MAEGLPLLPSGKVNRKALPAAEAGQPAVDTDFVAPRTPVENGLAQIWTEVLGVAPASTTASSIWAGIRWSPRRSSRGRARCSA